MIPPLQMVPVGHGLPTDLIMAKLSLIGPASGRLDAVVSSAAIETELITSTL